MRKGFTLIEILVVVSIIGLLSSVVSVFVQDAKNKANIAAGQQFEHQLQLALATQAIGEWTFDDSQSGTTVADTSGNSLTGSIQSSLVPTGAWTSGIQGGAIYFDGAVSNTYVWGTGMPDTAANSDLTISAWVNSQNSVGTKSVFTKGAATAGFGTACMGYGLDINNGSLVARTSVKSQPFGGAKIPDFVWTHVAVTFSASGVAKGYINGKLIGSQNIGTATCSNPTWAIGTNAPDDVRNGFIGKIDGIHVYAGIPN